MDKKEIQKCPSCGYYDYLKNGFCYSCRNRHAASKKYEKTKAFLFNLLMWFDAFFHLHRIAMDVYRQGEFLQLNRHYRRLYEKKVREDLYGKTGGNGNLKMHDMQD